MAKSTAPPSKARKGKPAVPKIPQSVGDSFKQGGRPMRGAVPKTVGDAMRQPGRTQHGGISVGSVPRMRSSMKQG